MSEQIVMQKGWTVFYEDGNQLNFDDPRTWKTIPKNGIQKLMLRWFHKTWVLENPPFVVFARGSIAFNGPPGTPIEIEERCLGYYEGPNKVVYRVNQKTGQMHMEVLGG